MRTQFTFYKSFDDVLEDMNNEQFVSYMRAILDVQFLRKRVDDVDFTDPLLKMAWKSQKHSIKTSIDGYLNSQKKENAKDPYYGVYSTPSEGGTATLTMGVLEQDKEKGKEEVKEKEQSKRFIAPTLQEIEAVIVDKSYSVNAYNFLNHYTANGWMIGKSKMKDWKSALAQWNSRASNNVIPTLKKVESYT